MEEYEELEREYEDEEPAQEEVDYKFWECLNCGYADSGNIFKGSRKCPKCGGVLHLAY